MQKLNLDSDTPQPGNVEFEIRLTPLALEMLADIKDQRQQQALSLRIDKLKTDPEKQGKPLVNKLKGYRSVRAVGQRYRIIYQVELDQVLVLVVGVGLRKEGDRADIYTLLQKLLEE
ncbi:type II toxin-antitoxin system RelE family toxin [Cylindrospermum sp. FACHB-282]|uniref:type II toxin-antitoxin system RelE family toxin n=1 Tax=Cylindrospermum sp. FACHB-282 TaxID=2692794 RepID=UPI001687BABE|nr:type II toxin-antitoxin system RelE/ParE family toxin [Cylindrospermum sp. FACHB-282]MBD2385794.1 type II toxin-antitoxin system RelE/ParE family toxin [Cylindrospermum sp. FACHB-282]